MERVREARWRERGVRRAFVVGRLTRGNSEMVVVNWKGGRTARRVRTMGIPPVGGRAPQAPGHREDTVH